MNISLIFGFNLFVFCTVCAIILWYIFHVVLPFSKLPSSRWEIFLLKEIFSKQKITKFLFQKFIFFGNKYYNEGLFVVWFFKPFLFIFNEEDVKKVLNQNMNKAAEYKMFHDVLGLGLFTCDESLWRKRRKMFNPVFRTKMVADTIPVFNKYSKHLVHKLSKIPSKTFVDVERLLKEFSFGAIYETITGTSLDDSSMYEAVELTERATAFLTKRVVKPWLYFTSLFPEGRTFQKDMKKIDEVAKKCLMKMKETELQCINKEKISKTKVTNMAFNRSFGDVMYYHHGEDPEFTEEDMITEIKTFIVGGFDTISTGLYWCLFLLGKHPEIQDRVYEEMGTLEGDTSFEDLQQLEYTECVIMETLRLYPPVPIIGRKTEKEMYCGKYKIPKGTSAIIFVYMHQRNPKVFPDRNKFDPDRFFGGNPVDSQWTNIVFSTGVRNCIGRKYAIIEMKIALVHILRKYKIISDKEPPQSEFGWEVFLKTEEPLLMKFLPRKDILHE